jgi:hypothetical protein
MYGKKYQYRLLESCCFACEEEPQPGHFLCVGPGEKELEARGWEVLWHGFTERWQAEEILEDYMRKEAEGNNEEEGFSRNDENSGLCWDDRI